LPFDETILCRLDPFSDRIEWMVGAFDLPLRPYRIGFPASSAHHKICSLRTFLQGYVLRHGRLPTGTALIPEKVDRALGHDAFEVDCDALASEAARICAPLFLPETYRLPRRKRVEPFRAQIEAIAAAFGDGAFTTPFDLAPKHRTFRMESFLKDYAVYYERLPRGTIRADESRTPFVLFYDDLGDVDFDRLRKAAGVPDETGDVDHDPRLAPFEDRIEWMIRAFDATAQARSRASSTRYAPHRIGFPESRNGTPRPDTVDTILSLRRHLATAAREDGRLPTGRARLPNAFEVDFDALAAEATALRAQRPGRHRLPKDRLIGFFAQQIEAIVCGLSLEPVRSTSGDCAPRRDWMRDFLIQYTRTYECFPRGKVKVDYCRYGGDRVDLGDVDFDRLGTFPRVLPPDRPEQVKRSNRCNRESDERRERARPFDSQIFPLTLYFMTHHPVDRWVDQSAGRLDQSSLFDWYLQDYVIEHGHVPTGRHRIAYRRWDGTIIPDDDSRSQSFEVDFDTLTETVARESRRSLTSDFEPPPPDAFKPPHDLRLSFHDRLAFFRRHIDAIAREDARERAMAREDARERAMASRADTDPVTSAHGWTWPRRRWLTLLSRAVRPVLRAVAARHGQGGFQLRGPSDAHAPGLVGGPRRDRFRRACPCGRRARPHRGQAFALNPSQFRHKLAA
jgi:hypothetical protein